MTDRPAGQLVEAWRALADRPAHGLADPTAALPVVTIDCAAAGPIVDQAATDLGQPWPPVPAHAWAAFHRSGDRREYEVALFARTARLARAVIAAVVTSGQSTEGAWLDEVADGVILLCEQSSWCWPAHDDAWQRGQGLLPDVDHPVVDLGSGEVAGLLAWIDHLVGQELEDRYPGLGRRIRRETAARVFKPFMTRRDWRWLGLDGSVDNWNPWIHGNILTAALVLADQPSERIRLVELCIEGLDRFLAALPADGATDEGAGYWWHGPGRLLEALDLLRHATGGLIDAFDLPAVRATVAFPHRMQLGGDWYVNYADASARPGGEQPWPTLWRLARRVGDGDAMAHAQGQIQGRIGTRRGAQIQGQIQTEIQTQSGRGRLADPADGLGRLALALGEAAAFDAQAAADDAVSPLPRDVYLPSVEVFLARERAGQASGLAVSAKGGHNDENHNHNDIGSVIVALDGVPAIVDAGRTTYTAQTFGPDRYSIWAMQSGWHNLPVIGGVGQGTGAQYRASQPEAVLKQDASQFSLDLATAYPAGTVTAWHRTVRLDRGSDGQGADVRATQDRAVDERATDERAAQVTISDRWQTGTSTAVELRYLLAGRVLEVQAGRLELETLGGGHLVLTWPEAVAFSLVDRPLDDPQHRRVWGDRLTQLRLDLTGQTSCVLVCRKGAQFNDLKRTVG